MDFKEETGTVYWKLRGADTWNPFKGKESEIAAWRIWCEKAGYDHSTYKTFGEFIIDTDMLTNIISSNTASDYLLTNMFLYEVLLSNIPILLMSDDYLVAEIKKRNSCIEILINNSSAMNALASSNILKSVYLVNISTGTSTSFTYNSVGASQSLNNAILISVYTMCFGQFWYGGGSTCSHIGITATVNNIGVSSSSWTQWNTYPQDGNYRQGGFNNTYINTQFYELSHELAASYSLMSLSGIVQTTGNLQAIFYYL